MDVNYSAIKPGLSLEHCNGILKRLESCSDTNAVKLFDWMRCKGKLKGLSEEFSGLQYGYMQFDGFSVSLEAYNSMLDAYGKDKQIEKFRSILKRMKKSTCGTDHYTYNIMINIYGEQGWIDEVTDILRELKESGLDPDLCSYNTLIKAYGIGGMVEEAVGLVKEMRGKKITPGKVTYTNLVTALRRNDEFLEAIKWSLWMKQMGI